MLNKKYIFLDFSGTLVKMRPAKLMVDINLLAKISQSYNLGIITGAKNTETFNIINKLRIGRFFKIIITKDSTKLSKPNPKLFPEVPIYAYIGDTKKDEMFASYAKLTFFRVNKKYNINRILKNLI